MEGKKEIIDALKGCAGDMGCAGCPYNIGPSSKCLNNLMRAAAEIMEKQPDNAIPQDWIREQIREYPGMHSASWSKLLRMWEEESTDGKADSV